MAHSPEKSSNLFDPPWKPAAKWIPDDASRGCMKCGAEFGRIMGSSRHHCRSCGQLICQTCMEYGEKESHSIVHGKEHVDYLAPNSVFCILDRPVQKSVFESAYSALVMPSKSSDVKFCASCSTNIRKENQAFRMATYFLSAVLYLPLEIQVDVVRTCVQSYMAEFAAPTAMGLIGADVVRTLRNNFYRPKVRERTVEYDRILNQILAGFFRRHVLAHLEPPVTDTKIAIMDSRLTTLHQRFGSHVFLNCLLNAEHKVSVNVNTLTYILSDVYRCMHILLSSSSMLHYEVCISPMFQVRTLKSVLKRCSGGGLGFFTKYPLIFADAVRSVSSPAEAATEAEAANTESNAEIARFSTFLNLNKTMGPAKSALCSILCHCANKTMFEATCRCMNIDETRTLAMFSMLYSSLHTVLCDADRLEDPIQVPWGMSTPNTLDKRSGNLHHPIVDVLSRVYTKAPYTVHVEHIVSSGTHHVARIFQTWFAFREPSMVLHQTMRHIHSVAEKCNSSSSSSSSSPCPMHTNIQYLHQIHAPSPASSTSAAATSTAATICFVPGIRKETRLVHLTKNMTTEKTDVSPDVLVTVLLLQHMATFMPLPRPNQRDGLNLVEMGYTDDNSAVVVACLTYSGACAVKEHLLCNKALHVSKVEHIISIMSNMVHTHLPELYVGMMCLTNTMDRLIEHRHVVAFLDSICQVVQEKRMGDLVLKYLV